MSIAAVPQILATVASLLFQQPLWTIERLPDTGQTRHYAATKGDDADVTIHPPAFRKNDDGSVTDLVTGLHWQQTDGGEMTWESAVAYCRALSLGGFDTWRLPSAQELFTIQNHGVINPALDTATAFVKTGAEYWWSIDKRADDPAFAWATNAGGGIGAHRLNETRSAGGTKLYHARCVRHSAVGSAVPDRYTGNGDGTVSDNQTGLMWAKSETAAVVSWEEALALAGATGLAGFADWRVPNIKELRSLQNDARMRPVIDSEAFPNTANAIYWSSTTQIGQQGVTAWTLDFGTGVVSYNNKTEKQHLRLVRGGAGPRISFAAGIRNAASRLPGAVAAGELLQIGVTANAEAVRIAGVDAVILAASDDVLTVVAPAELADAPEAVDVQVRAADTDWSPPYRVAVAAAAPAIFTAGGSGSGPAWIAAGDDGAVTIAATGLRSATDAELRINGEPRELLRVEGPEQGRWLLAFRITPQDAAQPLELTLLSAGIVSASKVTLEIP